MYERGVPGGALNLNSTGYPDHSRFGDLPLRGKIPMAEPGIEPGTTKPRDWSVRSLKVAELNLSDSVRQYQLQTITAHFYSVIFNYLNMKKVQCKHTVIR
jgi:hypothetical protein